MGGPTPVPGVAGLVPYRVPRHGAPMDLLLDGIGGLPTPTSFFQPLVDEAEAEALVRHYPDTTDLRAFLAARHGVEPDQVLVTCGADDALDRAVRTFVDPTRSLVVPVPTFAMTARYVSWTGGTLRTVPWDDGPWPLHAALGACDDTTAAVCVVSPNNPTGGTVSEESLRALSDALPDAAILLDLAYVEFADVDLTPVALELPNVLAFRTLSKAYGLAGLRVGYVVGPTEMIGWLQAAGNPYTVTGPSAWLAEHRLREGEAESAAFIEAVRAQRADLVALLDGLGLRTQDSQANYVFARTDDTLWLRDGLAGLGIGIRVWPGHDTLGDATRINVPGDDAVFSRLEHGLRTVLAPEALLLDMDGVIADVKDSYRAAILQTAASFGVEATHADVSRIKEAGDANNDWIVTHRLLVDHGIDADLGEVTARFERLYHGHDGVPGLKLTERLLLPRDTFERIAARLPIAIVTGRPHADAAWFLEHHGLADLITTTVAMEDGPAKPDPTPVRLALERLGVARAWMVGDTVDDIRAARAAGAVPLGVVLPEGDPDRTHRVLTAAGAARVLPDVTHLEELLP